jgi:hypothetical protein
MTLDNYKLASNPLSLQVGGDHYRTKPIQPVQYCMANNLNICEAAIVKYATRWADKGGVEDLLKIKHYVDLLIELDPRAKATRHIAIDKSAVDAVREEVRAQLTWEDDQ